MDGERKTQAALLILLACFVVLLVTSLIDMVRRAQFNVADYLSVILGVLGTIVTVASYHSEQAFREKDLELRGREVQSREWETETARSEYESKRVVCRARIRGMLESWLAAGPDYGYPVDLPYLERLSEVLAKIEDDCITQYPPIESLKADLSREISAAIPYPPTIESFEARVRELVQGLRGP